MNQPGREVVLHFRSGQTLHSELAAAVNEGDSSLYVQARVGVREVPIDELKAVFFLRRAEDPELPGEGLSQLAVEFVDGEIIRGTATQSAPALASFFLRPLERSKNVAILVVSSAVVSIDVEKL